MKTVRIVATFGYVNLSFRLNLVRKNVPSSLMHQMVLLLAGAVGAVISQVIKIPQGQDSAIASQFFISQGIRFHLIRLIPFRWQYSICFQLGCRDCNFDRSVQVLRLPVSLYHNLHV